MCEGADLDIPDVVTDRAHRIGNEYVDNLINVKCKRIIVRFTTFHHQTRFYRAKKKFKNGVKVKLDLTKKRHNLLTEANKYCDGGNVVKFCYKDVNCRPKVKWADKNEEDTFLSCVDDLLERKIESSFLCFVFINNTIDLIMSRLAFMSF